MCDYGKPQNQKPRNRNASIQVWNGKPSKLQSENSRQQMQQNFWVLLPVHKKTNTITSKCNDIASVDEAFLWFISLAIAFAESLSILAKLVASKFEKTVLIFKRSLAWIWWRSSMCDYEWRWGPFLGQWSFSKSMSNSKSFLLSIMA